MDGSSERCEACNHILENRDDIPILEKFILTLDVSASLINPVKDTNSKDKDRKKKRNSFVWGLLKYISALRNSKGGLLLVHIYDISEGDKCLEYFHELVDGKLHTLIEDGSLFVTTYKKDWLINLFDDIDEEYAGFVAITVHQSATITTLDFKTKEPLDNCILDPSNLTLRQFLRSSIVFADKSPHIRGILDNTIQENRKVQVKALLENGVHADVVSNPPSFIDALWDKFRLAQYVSAFSKIDGGGSFYLGVEETANHYKAYSTKHFKVKGFRFHEAQHQDFIKCLKDKANKEIRVLWKKVEGVNPKFSNLETFSQEESVQILEVKFHPVKADSDLYVLEVAVAAVEGLVFYDKEGPEAYEATSDGAIHRVVPLEWLRRLT